MAKKNKRPTFGLGSATISHLSHDGRGISQIDGKTTFIFNALADEHVHFRYQRQLSRFDEGLSDQVLKNPNPDRCQARCAHFTVCGGCQLQHLNYPAQVQHKQSTILALLQQQSIKPKQLLPAITDSPWGYRRKARLSVKFLPKKNKLVVGFRERMSHFVADIDSCHVLDPTVGEKLSDLNSLISKLAAHASIPQVDVTIAEHATVLIFRHLQPLTPADVDQLSQFSQQHNMLIYLQPGGLDSITPLNINQPITPLSYSLPDFNLELLFTPLQFIQINASINQKMIAQAITLLDIQPSETVLDLFCGLGNFSLPLATQATKVIGLESDKHAVAQAKLNATHNQLTNCDFSLVDLFSPPWQQTWARQSFDKILIDPPRSGALAVCQHISQWKPKAITYISCNPATFTRDANALTEQGYQLETLGIIDMFPHTKHIEIIALFKPLLRSTKKSNKISD